MENRMDEYMQIKTELEMPVPELEGTLERAKKRCRRRKCIQRPIVSMAAVFACFVLLVNFCTPIAYACSRIPGLRELAEAVTFSRSLSDAVEHEYVQPVDILLTDRGVTLSVEYLIVDQKQVNVFFRLDSDIYEYLAVNPEVRSSDGNYLEGCSYGCNDFRVPNGKLQSMTVDFIDTDVPGQLHMIFKVDNLEGWQRVEEADAADDTDTGENTLAPAEESEPDSAAEFQFVLEFDPEFTAAGRVVPVDQVLELDGQKIRFTELEIYPTHLRVNVAEEEGNTAWLKRLDFYIETDWGMKFDPVSNGITATGTEDSPMMVSYRADSTYFYEAKHLNIVVTGAEWLDKEMERIHLDLLTGEADALPEGAEIYSVVRDGDDWMITVKAKARKDSFLHQIFSGEYYDMAGTAYWREYWEAMQSAPNGNREEGYFFETFPLKNYPYEEVWLVPLYSREWQSGEKLTVRGW